LLSGLLVHLTSSVPVGPEAADKTAPEAAGDPVPNLLSKLDTGYTATMFTEDRNARAYLHGQNNYRY